MKCKGCGSKKIIPYDLCRASVAGYRCSSLEESKNAPLFELVLEFCTECNLMSQREYTKANPLLNKLYKEHVSTQHDVENPYFLKFAKKLISTFKITKKSKILEIGCNCGALLKIMHNISGAQVYGVEPSEAMHHLWKERGLHIYNNYLNSSTVDEVKKYGPFDLIYFRHVFEHISQPVEFVRMVSDLLVTEGVIALEVPYLKSIFEYRRVENVSYSHLNHYSIRSLDAIFMQFGMGLTDYSLENTDGGSIVAFFKKGRSTSREIYEIDLSKQMLDFVEFNVELKNYVIQKLDQFNSNELIGYGAGAKGQHLIHLLGLGKYITKVVDDTQGFEGKFIPGTEIQIVSSEALKDKKLKAVINLAPTHTEVIRKKIPKNIEFIEIINADA